ncbi:hypothetical protein LTR08_000653 [Meristemomyces frigidus]|nr:hypothetical protein LTR08_000653 [Meristemomyces frigidus]
MSDLDSMDYKTQRANPVKTYHLVNQHTFTAKQLEIQQDGHVILWANTKTSVFKSPVITLASQTAPVVAACTLENFSSSVRYYLGDPGTTNKSTWPICKAEGIFTKSYSLQLSDGRILQWKHTHNKELGASRMGSKTFKLVDGSGIVLAVFVHTQCVFKAHQVARIEYHTELGEELELASLIAMLGIQEMIRRNERA